MIGSLAAYPHAANQLNTDLRWIAHLIVRSAE